MKLSIIIPSLGTEVARRNLKKLTNEIEMCEDIELIVITPYNYTGYKIEEGKNMRVIKSKGKIYEAMNKGIENALGRWLYFCGDTDTPFIQNLSHVINSIEGDNIKERIEVATGFVQIGERLLRSSISKYNKIGISVERNPTHHQGIIYKKELVETVGKYDKDYSALADYKLNLEIRKRIRESN